MKDLIKELEELRDQWKGYADGIEATHKEDPGTKAYRNCCSALNKVIKKWNQNPEIDKKHP
jgi:hypothetical protein